MIKILNFINKIKSRLLREYSIKFKVIAILSLLSILLIFTLIWFVNYNATMKNLSNLTGLSAMNERAIHRLYYLVQHDKDVHNKELTERLLEQIDHSFILFTEGGENAAFGDQGIDPVPSEDIQKLNRELDSLWTELKQHLFAYMIQPREELTKINIAKNSVNAQGFITLSNPKYINARNEALKILPELMRKHDRLTRSYEELHSQRSFSMVIWSTIMVTLSIGIIGLLFYLIHRFVLKPIATAKHNIESLAKGNEKINRDNTKAPEIKDLNIAIDQILQRMQSLNEFIHQIATGDLSKEIALSGKNDVLGMSILRMLNYFRKTQKENEKKNIEDEERNWVSSGLANFGDILRNNNQGITDLSNDLIINLIKYLKADQGGVFIYHHPEEEEEIEHAAAGYNEHEATWDNEGHMDETREYLELVASVAYDKRKYLKKRVYPGEGLVGACFLEKEPMYLTDLPDDYLNISSGLGNSKPGCLYLMPLAHDDQVLGIIEIASMRAFKQYEIDFIQKIAENIASTISITRINENTNRLLEKSQKQAEELASQEEEMRQNLEEMQATQEEANKRGMELQDVHEAINQSVASYEVNREGQFINANKLYQDSLGLNRNQLFNHRFYELLKDNFENETAFQSFWKQLFTGNKMQKEMIYHLDGKKIRHFETFTPVHDINHEISKILVISIKENVSSNQ